MTVRDLTFQEAAESLILTKIKNIYDNLKNWKDILEDSNSIVYTAELVYTAHLKLGRMKVELDNQIQKCLDLGTTFLSKYEQDYNGSQWQTDLMSAYTALVTLRDWLVTQFNALFTIEDPVDPAIKYYIIVQLNNTQKNAIATQIGIAVGL